MSATFYHSESWWISLKNIRHFGKCQLRVPPGSWRAARSAGDGGKREQQNMRERGTRAATRAPWVTDATSAARTQLLSRSEGQTMKEATSAVHHTAGPIEGCRTAKTKTWRVLHDDVLRSSSAATSEPRRGSVSMKGYQGLKERSALKMM